MVSCSSPLFGNLRRGLAQVTVESNRMSVNVHSAIRHLNDPCVFSNDVLSLSLETGLGREGFFSG